MVEKVERDPTYLSVQAAVHRSDARDIRDEPRMYASPETNAAAAEHHATQLDLAADHIEELTKKKVEAEGGMIDAALILAGRETVIDSLRAQLAEATRHFTADYLIGLVRDESAGELMDEEQTATRLNALCNQLAERDKMLERMEDALSTAHYWVSEYRNDGENACHARRVLHNALEGGGFPPLDASLIERVAKALKGVPVDIGWTNRGGTTHEVACKPLREALEAVEALAGGE